MFAAQWDLKRFYALLYLFGIEELQFVKRKKVWWGEKLLFNRQRRRNWVTPTRWSASSPPSSRAWWLSWTRTCMDQTTTWWRYWTSVGPATVWFEPVDNDRGLMECFRQLWWWNWVVDQEIVQKVFLGGGWGWGGDSREVIDNWIQGSTCPDLSFFFFSFFLGGGGGGGRVKEDNRQIHPKLHPQIWQINGNKCWVFYHTEPH